MFHILFEDEKLQIIENKKTIEIDNGIEEESIDFYKNITESMSEREIRNNRAVGIATVIISCSVFIYDRIFK